VVPPDHHDEFRRDAAGRWRRCGAGRLRLAESVARRVHSC